MELIIIRHGRPERIENADGPADPPLTDIGRQQAHKVAEFLLAEEIDVVVSSPMRRARQTAAPLADALGQDPRVIEGLAEIDKDASDYIPSEEIRDNDPELWRSWGDDPLQPFGGREVVTTFAAGVVEAFEELIADSAGRTVVAFCHGMVTMAYLQHVLKHPDLLAVQPDYASITRIRASTSRPLRTVKSINETAHLGHTRIVL